ncbi:MAG TPA: DUF58 domain-containing protein [Candidatus Thermoplasmatota archaeon]|nr:DUF58 domain-containing protein [Candidatus Thermoplasmatota archaeon]
MTPDATATLAANARRPLHTRLSRGLSLMALGTAAVGLGLGNPVLLVLAAVVIAMVHAARSGWPGVGEVRFEVAADRVPRGRSVDVEVEARAPPAPAITWLHLELPKTFTLERGANLTVLGPSEDLRASLLVGCPKRGPYLIGPATLTAVHPLLLAPSTTLALAEPADLVVEPRVRALRGAKGIRGRARVPLGEDRGLRGRGSIDFREIREYERGDPLKSINWKATAKRSVQDLTLMVNDYEPEARKNVWFFLDLSRSMEVGTTLDNALEDGIEAALALAHHFLSRGHRVGGTTYNAPPLVFYPDTGSRQQLTIARGLANAAPGEPGEGLPAAVERVRGFLSRERPTVFVITRPELDPQGLDAGVRRIRLYAAGQRLQPVYVLAPVPAAATLPEWIAQALHAHERRGAASSTPGMRVLPLRDGVASLHAALARGVLSR